MSADRSSGGDGWRVCRALLVAALAACGAACGGRRVEAVPAPLDIGCAVRPTPASVADSASVVLTWPIDLANAPQPTNPAERFVFAHAFEPLVLTDCAGRLTPALAASWALVSGGTRVRLTLRDGARFWGGDPVTARDVIASWTAAARRDAAWLARRTAQGATAIDDRTLELDCITSSRDSSAVPQSAGPPQTACAALAVLGDPELAVAKPLPGSRSPEGTGPFRVRAARQAAPGSARPATTVVMLEPTGAARSPRLTIHSVGVADARDLIDAGTSLLLTDEPSLAAYAAARPELTRVPLLWDRTWVLVMEDEADSAIARSAALRAALARDAVRVEARAAEGPFWWREGRTCTVVAEGRARDAADIVTLRVAARRDEPIARALAERLVALGTMRRGSARDSSLALLSRELDRTGSILQTDVLAPNDFATALRTSSELALVLSLPRRSLEPCLDAARLGTAAPSAIGDPTRAATPRRVIPLIDTRLQALVRRDWLALTMTWDSTIVVLPR